MAQKRRKPNPRETDIQEFNAALAKEVREFLGKLAQSSSLLARYVDNPAKVISDEKLSTQAEALLLDTNFARVQAVMKEASPPSRWLAVWIV